jgi:hypothetical protein
MCSPTQPDHFICPSTEVFGTASVIWGLIGPRRIFSPGHTYYLLIFFFLIGSVSPAVTPIPSSNRQLPRYLLWNRSHSTLYSCQLRPLGNCRFHLPVLHLKKELLLVEQVQLRPFCRTRFWCGDWSSSYILHFAIP